jgi:low affinity Fe/Cu permease
LSELILAMKGADNKVAGIEDATEDELQKAHQKVKRKAARKKIDSPLRDA